VVPERSARLAVERRHPLQPRVEVVDLATDRLALALRRLDVLAQLGGGDQQRALARVAAALPPVRLAVRRRVVAAQRRAQQRRERLGRRQLRPQLLRCAFPTHTVGKAHRKLLALRPQRPHAHPPLGQRAGLVGADHVGRAERLDRGQPLDQRPPPRHPSHADGQRQGDRRQEALGHVGDQQADREGRRVAEREAGDRAADGEEDNPGGDRDRRDQQGHPVDLHLQRARLGAHPLRERRDAAELRAHPGREDDRLRLAAGAERSREDQVRRLQRRHAGLGRAGQPRDRLRLAGQRRGVDLDRALDQARVGAQPVALVDQQQVPRHQLARVDLDPLAAAADARPRGQVLAQRLGRALGLQLLAEGEEGVEHDHRDDRRRQGEHPGGRREPGGEPEQQRQRVRELERQVAQPARPLAALDQVGAVLLEPAPRLARR